MSKTFTSADVASHNKATDLYIVVDGDVYDVTKFQDDHPGMSDSMIQSPAQRRFHPCTWNYQLTGSPTGGKKILQRVAGKDASKQFWKYHNEGILKKWHPKLHVGSLDTKPKPKEEPKPEPAPGTVTVKQPSAKAVKAAEREASSSEESEPLEPFGHQIPFADPSWYQNVSLHMAYVGYWGLSR